MRTRAVTALATCTLALTALAVPAAQAAPGAAPAAPADPKIISVSANGGKDLVLGLGPKSFDVTITASDESGIAQGAALAYWGASLDNPYRQLLPDDFSSGCREIDATTSACTTRNVADPDHYHPRKDVTNELAGPWKLAGQVLGRDGSATLGEQGTLHIKRAAKLTADASPEPVRRGADLTVTGALTRADWDRNRYGGFTSNAVKLQFKKDGATAWTTVRTVRADARGTLRTTVKATTDGTYRYQYGGSRTTGPAASGGDRVDVR
ncbi:calcium-binding protein [Streptomyces sp. NPDC049906]|uniref:calcium-binding protein n=1 Tax=Streptomyces sp. NPDC049906 TaxID=3155656 RepID=UPI00343F064A